MNVLIADDDRITREGIHEFVDWESLGLTVVATAKDGREALELLSCHDVDILITDIRMPYMTGFELVNAASSKGRFPATIIISGYDDYEYLQQAIQLHIILGYIFKPIQLEQMERMLRDAIRFRREWLQKIRVPELTDQDHSRFSYKNVVVNLQNLEAVYQGLKNNDIDHVMPLFRQSWNHAIDAECSLNFTRRYAWEFFISLTQLLAKDGINAMDITMGSDPLSLIAAIDQKEEVFKLICGFLENVALYLSQQNHYADSKFYYVQQALETRFADPELSLQLLAGELDVTANYLGALYRKERGWSFGTELTNRRIEQAKELLSTSNSKVADIAAAVGFSDSKYFAVTFRKVTNMTPSEYRTQFYRRAT